MGRAKKVPRCANCQTDVGNQQSTYREFMTVSDQTERTIGTTQAITTIFEGAISFNQKSVPPDTNIEMCFQCISILAELFRFYTEFLEMTQNASYIQSLIQESVVWNQSRSNTALQDPLEPDPSYSPNEFFSSDSDNSNPDYTEDVKFFPEDAEDYIHENMPTSNATNDEDHKSAASIKNDKTKGGLSISRITRSMTEQVKEVLNDSKESSILDIRRRIIRKAKATSKPKPLKKYIPRKKATGFKCEHCKATFTSQQRLESHCAKLSHSIDLTCLKCKKVYRSGRLFRRHLLMSHGEAPVMEDLSKRTCPVCSKVFNTSYLMRNHSKFVHIETKDYQCTECGKQFSAELYLRQHVRNSHSSPDTQVRFPCDQCGFSFKAKHGLSRHLNSKHVEEDQKIYYSCDECGKRFSRPNHLKMHKTIHESGRTKSFICSICSKCFYDNNQLKNHMKTHDGQKDSLCTICGATFLAACSLKRHIEARHTDEQVMSSHTCHICGKSFKLKEYLLQHLRAKSHGGDGHTAHKRKIGLLNRTGT